MRFSLHAILFAGVMLALALPARAAELIMVEQPGCQWCAMWNAEVSAAYPKTPEGAYAPLRRVQLKAVRAGDSGIDLARPVNFTPTFLLVEDNAELGRIEGYPGEDFFWGLLQTLLVTQTGYGKTDG